MNPTYLKIRSAIETLLHRYIMQEAAKLIRAEGSDLIIRKLVARLGVRRRTISAAIRSHRNRK
jgi:hypothetical protein